MNKADKMAARIFHKRPKDGKWEAN